MTDHYNVHTDEVSRRLEEKDYFPAMSRYRLNKMGLTPEQERARLRAHLQPRRTMTTFTYTDYLNAWGSSAISGAYYNEDTAEVAVILRTSDVYVYDDFTSSDWEAFKSAFSKGRFYAKTIKRDFGPGESLGDTHNDVTFKRASVPAPDMGSVGTPKDLTYAADAVVDGEKVNEPVGSSTGPSVSFTGSGAATNVYNLSVNTPAPEGEKFDHEVVFTVDDGPEKTYKTRAGSVNEAREALEQVAEMLDLTFTVKRVVTIFE